MNTLKISFLVICVLAVSASSQTPAPTGVDQMKKLDFLLGEWKGEGWELTEDGERGNTFSQTTKVQAKDGNAVLTLQDRRKYHSKSFFHSSSLDATIVYNETTKLYNWRGKNSKSVIEVKLIEDRTLQFGMPFSVRVEPREDYRKTTIRVTESGSWEETLEVWRKEKWNKVEQSILTRVK